MDLWIRSQDKSRLTKCKSLFLIQSTVLKYNEITESAIEEKIEHYSINNDNELLGFYLSKERCLEIIDDINQYMVENAINDKTCGFYNMPKE